MFLDDLVDLLRDGGIKPHVAALRTDQRRDVLKAVELRAPGLRVGNGLRFQTSVTFGTFFRMLLHSAISFESADRSKRPDRTSGR